MKRLIFTTFCFVVLLSCENQETASTKKADFELVASETYITYKATQNRKDKYIVLVSGDEEYRSEEALPQLAKILAKHHGFDCTVLFAQDPESPGLINPNFNSNISGLSKLKEADAMVLFTRFRALSKEQMSYFENYLLNGKPVFAIRTATHAFNFKDESHPFYHYSWNYEGEKTEWHSGFGKFVLGETWFTHHGHHKHQSTRGIFTKPAINHPITSGISDGSIWGPTDVYGIRTPIGGDAQSIILGQTIDRLTEFDEADILFGMRESDNQIATKSYHSEPDKIYNPNEEMPPIVWSKSYQLPGGKEGKSITSTIGSSTDMLDEEVRRLMVNTLYFLLEIEVPKKAQVELVGKYEPTAFQFHTDEYWKQKNLKVKDIGQ